MKLAGLFIALAFLFSGCGANKAIKATNSMPKKMDDMLDEMKNTSCTMKRGLSFEAMLKEEFGRVLIPVPFDLMPFAREFAQCASDEDLAELSYVWMKKLNEVTLDVPNPTDQDKEVFNHKQLHV